MCALVNFYWTFHQQGSSKCFQLYRVVTLPVHFTQVKECAAEELGKGYLVSCLVDHRSNISDYQCNQYITKMTSIVFSDYRLICGFMDKCRDDINVLRCGSISTGEKVRCKTWSYSVPRWKFHLLTECISFGWDVMCFLNAAVKDISGDITDFYLRSINLIKWP